MSCGDGSGTDDSSSSSSCPSLGVLTLPVPVALSVPLVRRSANQIRQLQVFQVPISVSVSVSLLMTAASSTAPARALTIRSSSTSSSAAAAATACATACPTVAPQAKPTVGHSLGLLHIATATAVSTSIRPAHATTTALPLLPGLGRGRRSAHDVLQNECLIRNNHERQGFFLRTLWFLLTSKPPSPSASVSLCLAAKHVLTTVAFAETRLSLTTTTTIPLGFTTSLGSRGAAALCGLAPSSVLV